MGFIQDILPLFRKIDITFSESYKDLNNVHSFIFEKGEDVNWKAGQHGIFTITHKKIKKSTRPFSVASSASEGVIKLTMKISDNPSEFKQAMLELKKDMKISMRGPIGPLYINEANPSLLVAGGIGITPFRAMLKEFEIKDGQIPSILHLLYIDSQGSFVYKDELEAIAKNIPLKVDYISSKNELYNHIETFTTSYSNMGKYYLGGPKSMVDTVSEFLKGKDIKKSNIKKDVFFGYK